MYSLSLALSLHFPHIPHRHQNTPLDPWARRCPKYHHFVIPSRTRSCLGWKNQMGGRCGGKKNMTTRACMRVSAQEMDGWMDGMWGYGGTWEDMAKDGNIHSRRFISELWQRQAKSQEKVCLRAQLEKYEPYIGLEEHSFSSFFSFFNGVLGWMPLYTCNQTCLAYFVPDMYLTCVYAHGG